MIHKLLPRLAFAVVILASHWVGADVRLPSIISDHMVLQRGVPILFWGWGSPGETVQIEFVRQVASTTVDANGKWKITLNHVEDPGPHVLAVRGKNQLKVDDVLVGEVWLGSGQSNMAMQVSRCRNFEAEKRLANYPELRMFTVTSGPATTPQEDCTGKWVVCQPDTVGQFSGTAYFFARELVRKLDRPVGIINSSVGGTGIEAWTAYEVQAQRENLRPILETWNKLAKEWNPEEAQTAYKKSLERWTENSAKARSEKKKAPRRPQPPQEPKTDRNHPGNLFNGKIAPLIPYALKGFIWYQGERNTTPDVAHLYGSQLSLLINDWRQRWGQGDLPFGWVQLPNYNVPGRNWPLVREGMLQTLSLPQTGMAITIDIGDPQDIHPANKQDVGHRLGLWALSQVYGLPIGSWSGPVPQSNRVVGDSLQVEFRHVDGGLVARGADQLRGFEIAGNDRKFVPASAKIDGRFVRVSSDLVRQPVAVRYAWSANPNGNLYNAAGLPASPFRTDNWGMAEVAARNASAAQESSQPATTRRPPNIVLILFDDLGYGDLGCFGATDIQTPNIDLVAKRGTRLTNFYVSQPVCSASRASLLTGCYANRVGLEGALNHTSTTGIAANETLVSELCRDKGYATAVIGKWHLGLQSMFNPLEHGFDEYHGLPYSNDNSKFHPVIKDITPLPFFDGHKVIEQDPDQAQFTSRFTDRAVSFIDRNHTRPFFLYLPHVMPHVPIFSSEKFKGSSKRGLYGDVVQELDHSVGRILAALKTHNLEDQTWIIISSDNGPFLSYGEHAGSAGNLREGKLTVFEGGVRVPCLMSWPGVIPAESTLSEPIATIDLLPTIAGVIGADLPSTPIDGSDVLPVLMGKPGAKVARESLLFYAGTELHAIRSGDWKLHFPHPYLTVDGTPGKGGKPANFANLTPKSITQSGLAGIASRHGYRVAKTGTELYNLASDLAESRDVAAQNPRIVEALTALAEKARQELGDSLTGRVGSGVRKPGSFSLN